MREFDRLVEVIKKLRQECPWDREQTHQSLKPFMTEEVNEALEAIDHGDDQKLAEELGDQLLHIIMHAEISSEFTIEDIINYIANKMILRHPHVFSKIKADTKEEIWKNWDIIKGLEDKASQYGVKLKDMDIEQMQKVWDEVKKSESKKT